MIRKRARAIGLRNLSTPSGTRVDAAADAPPGKKREPGSSPPRRAGCPASRRRGRAQARPREQVRGELVTLAVPRTVIRRIPGAVRTSGRGLPDPQLRVGDRRRIGQQMRSRRGEGDVAIEPPHRGRADPRGQDAGTSRRDGENRHHAVSRSAPFHRAGRAAQRTTYPVFVERQCACPPSPRPSCRDARSGPGADAFAGSDQYRVNRNRRRVPPCLSLAPPARLTGRHERAGVRADRRGMATGERARTIAIVLVQEEA